MDKESVEGKNKIPDNFNWRVYIDNYPDLRKNGIDNEEKAKRHWADYGKKEGRIYNIDSNILYFFYHIQKTGGTTLRENLKVALQEKLLSLYIDKGFFNNAREMEKYLEGLSEKDKATLRAVIGHFVSKDRIRYFSRNIRTIVFLRNPADTLVSFYNHFRRDYETNQKKNLNYFSIFSDSGDVLSFWEWFEKHKKLSSFYCDLIINGFSENKGSADNDSDKIKEAKKILEDFYFVGITENPMDFLFVYKLLGIQNIDLSKKHNISTKYFIPDDYEEFRAEISSKCKLDIELYEYARELNKKFKDSDEYKKIVDASSENIFDNLEKRYFNEVPHDFNWKTYLDNYPDLRKNGIDNEEKARQHWLNYGRKEERIWKKLYNPDPSNLNNP